MRVLGIIAEFNPMHIGHKYLIEQAKKQIGASHVILVISGNFTQARKCKYHPKIFKS